MKIAGVIENYEEAEEIENIVKVFVIKERISNLQSLKENKKLKKRSANKTTSIDDNKRIKTFNKSTFHNNSNNVDLPLFNFRGLS